MGRYPLTFCINEEMKDGVYVNRPFIAEESPYEDPFCEEPITWGVYKPIHQGVILIDQTLGGDGDGRSL